MSTEFTEIASKKYPEFDSYKGDMTEVTAIFRNVSAASFFSDWLIDTVVDKQAEQADSTPLQARLYERKLEIPYLPDIISEYKLVVYYHDSPFVILLSLAIAAALAAAGFLVMTIKSEKGSWNPSTITGNVKDTAKYMAYAAIAVVSAILLKSAKGFIPSKT